MAGYSHRTWVSLSFLRKMNACIKVLGYKEEDFHFYNEAYKLLDGLSQEDKTKVCEYAVKHPNET